MADNKPSALALSVDEAVTQNDNQVTLSTGVVLNVTPVSSMLFTELQKRNKQPRPPIFFNKENDRKEENPNDPDYIQAKADWEINMGIAMVDVMILFGTAIESVPNGFPKVNEDTWEENLQLLGTEISSKPRARYLSYIKFVACAAPDDMGKIMGAVSRLSGVSQEDADAAAEQFRTDN